MDYSEFKRQLGADPTSQDPDFLRARQSSPEFVRAAAESDRLEHILKKALTWPAPPELVAGLKDIAQTGKSGSRPWRSYALAASVLLAVAVAGMIWRMNPGYDSVEQYVAYHYGHDGPMLVARGEGKQADNVDAVLTRFHLTLAPQAKRMVGVIKICPTPSGKGAHMVLNTSSGPISIIFMPDTAVTDGEMLDFDGMQAQLLVLSGGGSAAVIGTHSQHIGRFRALVQSAFIPISTEA